MSKPIANPYVGPRAFEEGEGARFFGRDRELAKLLNLLIARRLVLLHAPSGAGKTSLIQAALIPRLRDEGFVVRRSIRVHAEVPPEVESLGPNRYLLSTLTALDEEVPPAQRSAPADLAQISLTRYLDQRRSDGDVDEVLIFDQFEEVLTADTTDRAAKDAFLAELGAALEDPHRWALFAIREDYLGQLRPLLVALPTRLDTLFRLDLLDPAHARRAVQEPARAVGGNFRDEAAAKLIDDLRQTSVQRPDGGSEVVLGQSIEPMQLQVVCYRLWERKTGGGESGVGGGESGVGEYVSQTISLEDLAEAGDVDTALRDYYAEQIAATASASGVDERRIRDWVEENLITESGLRGQVLRAPDATGGLANTVIRQLVDAHLVRAEERRGVTWYELAHDRLIAPVRQDNAAWFDSYLSTLQRQARLWDRADRPDGLLLRGEALRQAERDLREPELSESEQAFLSACRVARSVEERERRQNRRIRMLAWVASLGGVFALMLAGVAWSFYGKANTALVAAQISQAQAMTAQAKTAAQLRRSEAQRLAFAAQSERENNPTGALLFAAEAFSRERTQITRDTLRSSLDVPVPSHTLGSSYVWSAAYSPDGKQIVTTLNDGTAIIWDVSSGKKLTTFVFAHRGSTNPWTAAYSPDSQHIVTTSHDGTAIIWNATNGAKLITLTGCNNTVTVYSPDGQRIVTTSLSDGTAVIWDTTNGTKLSTLISHTSVVYSAAYSPDGQRIITGSDDGTTIIWNATNGARLTTLTGHSKEPIRSVAYSPDGQYIITASADGTAIIWNATNGTRLTTLTGDYAAYSPDGQRIVTTSNGTAMIWDAASRAKLATLPGLSGALRVVTYSPDSQHIVTVLEDGTAAIWDVANGTKLTMLVGHNSYTESAAYSPNGQYIVTASSDGNVIIWNSANGAKLRTLPLQNGDVYRAIYSPDGQRIITVSNAGDGTAIIWDAVSGVKLATLIDGSNYARSVAYSPDGQRIVTGSDDGTISIWDTITGVKLATLTGHDKPRVLSVAYSPDSRYIVSMSYGTAIVWDATSGKQISILADHSGSIISVDYNPDGQHIVTVSDNGTIISWDVVSGRQITMFASHDKSVRSATYSPNGQHIVTASNDGTIIIWDAVTHEKLAVLADHIGEINSVVYSPDGQRIVAGSDDGTAIQYLANDDDLLKVAACRLWRDFTTDEIARFGISQPPAFSRLSYSCPPVYSWQQGTK